MYKVLVLGATGMLGHTVYYYLKKHTDYNLSNLVFKNKLNEDSIVCDITNTKELERIIIEDSPDVIVNCIGVLINGSKAHASNAIFINSYLPHFLSELCKRLNIMLIHVSTDCVFSGSKGSYLEGDFKDADDVYGRSKSLGELNNEHALTLRTSIIGPELKQKGEGLLHWFLNQSDEVSGYQKVFWGGVTTLELAKAIDYSIQEQTKGLVHVTNNIAISKFDLLTLFSKNFPEKCMNILPESTKKSDKSLKTNRKDFNFTVSSYEEMIKEMRDFMEEHRDLYSSVYSY